MPNTRSSSRHRNPYQPLEGLADTSHHTEQPSSEQENEDESFEHDDPPHLNPVHSPDSRRSRSSHRSRGSQQSRTSQQSRGRRSGTHDTPDTDNMSAFERMVISQNNLLAANHQSALEGFQTIISNLIASQSQPRASATKTATTAIPAKIRMADPEPFTGLPRTTDSFLNSCVNIFMAQPLQYPSVESRVRFALSFIRGDATRWRDGMFKDIGNGDYLFTSWDDFTDRLRESFGDPFRVEDAQRKMHTIEQGRRTAEEFFIEFEDLKSEAGFCDASVIFNLKRALRKEVRDEVNCRIGKMDTVATYREWKSIVLKVDKDLRGSAADHSFFSGATSALAPRRFNNGAFRNKTASTPTGTSSALTTSDRPRTSGPTSTTINTKDSSSAPARKKACYGCGSLEHLWRDCPKTKFGEKARVLLERVDEVDASVETMRKMMEDASQVDDEDDGDTEIFARVAADYPEFFVESDE
jgi:hypothetical protein